jgi:hypothetical protein
MTDFIPPRFREAVRSHLVLSYAEYPSHPLIFGIFGRPGDGKTFQLRHVLAGIGVETRSINAADLESDRAGTPGKLLLETYVMSARALEAGRPSALVVDDFDTTVGEWEHNTGTVNHQQILAQAMHLADNPSAIDRIGTVRRVPLFLTGNDFSKLYGPLRRPGRMVSFYWEPTPWERKEIVASILDFTSRDVATRLIEEFRDAPISFFAELRSRLYRYNSGGLLERLGADLRAVVDAPERFRHYIDASVEPGRIRFDILREIGGEIRDSARFGDMAHLDVYIRPLPRPALMK